eukprot:9502772-Karenia_brevis.AAC.1
MAETTKKHMLRKCGQELWNDLYFHFLFAVVSSNNGPVNMRNISASCNDMKFYITVLGVP